MSLWLAFAGTLMGMGVFLVLILRGLPRPRRGSEPERLARLLVTEIKLYHSNLIAASPNREAALSALSQEIELARGEFRRRFPDRQDWEIFEHLVLNDLVPTPLAS